MLIMGWIDQGQSRVTMPRGLLLAVLFRLSVAAISQQAGANVFEGIVEPRDPNVAYFPDKAHVQHAAGFTVR